MVCTVRHEGLAHDKLLMVEMLTARGEPDGQCAVAIDSIGAGMRRVGAGSGSLGATGARTRRLPVDLCVIGIVDEAAADGQVLFHK